MTSSVRIAIIGSGPSGLSCAAHAAKLGVTHLLLEAESHVSHTIYRYQKGKHVMAEPAILPLRSDISFGAGRREAILGTWQQEVEAQGVNIRYDSAVTAITGAKGAFEIVTARGERHLAETVVLCIGLQGNIRQLGVPGDDHARVQYQLDDPDEYSGETIVVVGAGDAGIENALALADHNRVILLNRTEELFRVKQGNADLVNAAVASARMECRHSTSVTQVEAIATDGRPLRLSVSTPLGIEHIACDRIIARLGAIAPRKLVESFGVTFPSASFDAVPQVSDTYESNVPGFYIIGALGGYPLIKQAMNQGYEVVEHILGNPVEPADESLLRETFRHFKRATSVSDALALVQQQVPLFKGLSTLQLREFMLDSEVTAPAEAQLVFRKNDYTNSFFSIVEGEVLIEVEGEAGQMAHVTLGSGQFFGELGLLSGRRRSRTVRAGRGCVLIETPRRSMLKLLASNESVRRCIDGVSLRRAIGTSIAPFVSEAGLDELVEAASVKSFTAGQTLFAEGDEADGLHLIRRGSVTVSKLIGSKEVVLSYVAAGNYVGEMALLNTDSRRSATVRAAVNCETIVLSAERFRAVLDKSPAMRKELEASSLQRVSSNVQKESDNAPGDLISFLIGQGLGEGTDVLLIDQGLCIGCDNCERACAVVHDGTSRLDREAGPTFANIHVPTSCRHCENPHCMKDCPPDAIHRNPHGEVFIDDTCIGCGNCERNCPYGVIQLAQQDPARKPPSLLTWLLTGLTPEPGREAPVHSKELGKKAVKCDMCSGLSGGAACVRACPTGAAIRVSPEEFIDYAGKSRV
jgi:CRP-like cAMP-binding protein/Fe-S-cluster-containing hydrogenase component 2/thioredoxin reductase